jgi:hypothetical protein
MRLQKKNERWQCLPVAFAMVLGVDQNDIYEGLCHDGGEILWDDLQEPENRRGFHIQELIRYACSKGHAVTPFEVLPILATRDGRRTPVQFINQAGEQNNLGQVLFLLEKGRGVLECVSAGGKRHAVAFEDGMIYDPDGIEPFKASEKSLCRHNMFPVCAWVLT